MLIPKSSTNCSLVLHKDHSSVPEEELRRNRGRCMKADESSGDDGRRRHCRGGQSGPGRSRCSCLVWGARNARRVKALVSLHSKSTSRSAVITGLQLGSERIQDLCKRRLESLAPTTFNVASYRRLNPSDAASQPSLSRNFSGDSSILAPNST